MKSKIHVILLYCFLVFTAVMGTLQSMYSQDIIAEINDTTEKKPVIIALPDISIRSGEMVIKTKKILESLLPDEQIPILRRENDSLLVLIDSLLQIDKPINLGTKNIRYLNNKLVYWEGYAVKIESQKSSLSEIIHGLDEKKYELEEEILIWENTYDEIIDQDPANTVIKRINDLVAEMNNAKNLIQGKSDLLLTILDRATSMGLVLNDHIEGFEDEIISQQEAIFVQNQPPIWKTNFSNSSNWSITNPLHQFYRMEIKELIVYFQNNVINSIFQVVLLIILVLAFRVIKQRVNKTEINNDSRYQKMLVQILSKPISAALILGLFASVLIFSNRPLLLRDLSRLLISLPLIIIIGSITNKKFHKYFYILFILMVIQMISFIYPPGNIFYLFSLIAIGLIEAILLRSLFIYFKTKKEPQILPTRVILIVLVIHLSFALTGLLGILLGASILAEIALNFTIINTFIGMLVITSAFIINGLIEVGIASPTFQKINVFRIYGRQVEKRSIQIINLGGLTLWLFTIMKVLNIKDYITEGVTSIFIDEIHLGSASFTLGGIVIFFLVIWLSIVVSKIVHAVLEEDVLNNLNLAKGVPHTISVMVRYTLVTIGVFLAVSAAGMELDSLTILFGAFGVGIGFGLQNIFNNLVSGLILLFERPIQIGDTIEVGELMGNVKSIGIRSSNVRTFDGAEVIVPNGLLISNEVVNWTLSDQTRRIEVLAGVAYGSDPHQVRKLFVDVLNNHPDIIKKPPPLVLFNDLGESSLDFRLLFWTSNFDEWIRIRSEIIFSVHDILKEEGIEIPFPQRDLHLRSVGEQIEIVQKDKKEK